VSELLYGIHPVHEALAAGRRRVSRVYVSKSRGAKGVQALLDMARTKRIPVEYKAPGYFTSCFGDSAHQGVAAHASELPLSTESAILRQAEADGELPLVLALDGLVDPQNLGSVVRTALAMGAHGAILTKTRSAPLSPAVSKASAGAMEHVLFARVSNLVASLERFKKAGLWVVGAHSGSGQPVDRADFSVGLVLVIGSEGKGLRPLVRKVCDYLVSVPQKTVMDSLNAAVAGAIVMYEIGRQRRLKKMKDG
jgi:23S rRNA (guanosine2251-2'-O)-methyltransferase